MRGAVADLNVKTGTVTFDVPVVSRRVADVFQSVAGLQVQRVPVKVEGSANQFEIINTLASCDCLDEERSEFMKWTPEDRRPDRLGHYRMVTKLTVNETRAQGLDAFRIEGWDVPLIVSSRLKEAVLELRPLGVVFEPV